MYLKEKQTYMVLESKKKTFPTTHFIACPTCLRLTHTPTSRPGASLANAQIRCFPDILYIYNVLYQLVYISLYK